MMERKTSESGHPRRGPFALAACLGLLLLVIGCILAHGESDNAQAKKAAFGGVEVRFLFSV